jgi:hypothetical protein
MVSRDKPLALAMHQAQASSLAMPMPRATDTLGETPLKTESFRFHQRVHAPRMNSELSPPWSVLWIELIIRLHRSLKDDSEG